VSELERVTGPNGRGGHCRAPGSRNEGADQALDARGLVGLLGGLVAIVGLLIGVLGGVVALLSAGVPDLPRLTLLLEPGLTALGLLLKALLALLCLTLTVAGRGQLSFECPAALPEALKSSQVGELVSELLAVGSRVLGLLAGGCGVSERVGHLWVAAGPPFACL